MDSQDNAETNTTSEIEKKISKQACDVLNELRKGGQLCDAVISVDKEAHFSVHRAIMSACSPYFRALFTNGMNDTEKREVYIPGVSADMMAIIIDYAYTREAGVTPENVERLLPAADQFHVLGLVKACIKFLGAQLDHANCIGIRQFAKDFFCEPLDKLATKFVMEHFSEVATKNNELLNLKHHELITVLESDELNVKNEEIVFDCVIRWISHDPRNRKQHILALLKTIRLGLLSTQYFVETAKNHPYIKDNESCRPLVIETLKFLYNLDMGEKDVDYTHPLARPRIPYEVMFVIGGWSGGSSTNVIETYDTRADRWIKMDHLDKGPRAYHGCATIANKIYVVGGFDGTDYFNSCRCFDPEKKQWDEVAPMNSRRCYVSVAVLNNCIYAMGGFDGNVRQNTAERYTPKNNQWSLISPMNHQRSDASATSCDGKVYICGGFNGQECLNSAEYYDPETNTWALITPMRSSRSGVGVVSHGNYVYALGGFNGIARMNSGEKYNPVTNTWTSINEMYSPRSNFGIEVIDDNVFAIGGFNGTTTIYHVECFDPEADEWFDCTDMNIFRSALSACVVHGIQNVRDYIHQDRFNCYKKNNDTSATESVIYGTDGQMLAAADNVIQPNGQPVAVIPPINNNNLYQQNA